MVVSITCKNEEDPIKIEHVRVLTSLNIDFSDTQGQLTPKSFCRIWPNLELLCTLMIARIICKNEKDLIKNEGTRVLTTFSPV